MLNGIGVSKGIAIGQAHILYREQPEVIEYSIGEHQVQHEIARFQLARNTAQQQLKDIKQKISTDVAEDITQFIDTHLLMLSDPTLYDETIKNIQHKYRNAEWALQTQCDRLISVFDNMDDEYLKTRKDDVRHVVQRIQQCMLAPEEPQQDIIEDHMKGRIIVADDLTPADTLLMQHQKVAGFITEYGGPLSHTAILARNLGIPALVGVHNARQIIQANESVIVDGKQGMVITSPDRSALRHFRSLQKDDKLRRKNLISLKNKPAITQDGARITLQGNIDRPDDVRILRQYDHTGVGLYRTEVLFMEGDYYPSEEEQFEIYRKTLRALKGHPLTIRTIDLGADKELDSTLQHGPMAHNPAMGLRAIRRCLKEPEQFLHQLRAILRTAAYGSVKMMVPMLTCISEIHQLNILLAQAKAELKQRRCRFNADLSIGAMIEVPAAALAADAFASQLDFLSIGTNDLIQYTLALDRIDDEVSHLYNPSHPSVLKLIAMSLDAGRKKSIEVSLCGEMASDPFYTRLLLGMGLRCFSVQANSLLEIKHIINHSRISELQDPVNAILNLHDPADIDSALQELNHQFTI